MKASLLTKITELHERFAEISALLATPEVIEAQDKFKALSKEYAELEPIATTYDEYLQTQETIVSLDAMTQEEDEELANIAKEELQESQKNLEKIETTLLQHLIPKDPDDNANIFLEVRAGTGGDEAAIFAGDLFRMYSRYAEIQGWELDIIHANQGEHGGYKEVVVRVSGQGVYAHLKFESGTHRVQRVPETEAQGRIHTSACTVAILKETSEIHKIDIRPEDLRVDTYRASGAGGQHVNKTDSAIRITHLPTGLVVECQDERSQHKNRAKAMALLQSRLLDAEQSKQRKEEALARKIQVGSGDRSERIRTYNFPQGRLTDHRINLTLYQLNEIMEGHMEPVIDALRQEHHATLLQELSGA